MIATDSVTIAYGSKLGFEEVQSRILGNKLMLRITGLTEDTNYTVTIRPVANNFTTPKYNNQLNTSTNTFLDLAIDLPQVDFVVGNYYYLAVGETGGQEGIQVKFKITQNLIDGAGETIINYLSADFTLSGTAVEGGNKLVDLNSKATQAEAEAGLTNDKWMTPLRTSQAFTYSAINKDFSGLTTTSKKIIGALNELDLEVAQIQAGGSETTSTILTKIGNGTTIDDNYIPASIARDTELPTLTSELTNDSGFLTETDLNNYVNSVGDIVIVQAGQSNATGFASQAFYDPLEPADQPDSRIFSWTGKRDNPNGEWVEASLQGAVIGDKNTDAQSMIFHTAKAILAEFPNKRIFLITNGQGGRTINYWLTEQLFNPLDENVTEALLKLKNFANVDKKTVDLFVWTQGEADKNRATTDYEIDIKISLFTHLYRTTWFDRATPFVITKLKTGMTGNAENQNAVLSTFATDNNVFRTFVGDGIPVTGTDPIHYDSPAMRLMGGQIWTNGLKKIWNNTLGKTFIDNDYTGDMYSRYEFKTGEEFAYDNLGNNSGRIMGSSVVTNNRLVATNPGGLDDLSGRVQFYKIKGWTATQAWTLHFKATKSNNSGLSSSRGFIIGQYGNATGIYDPNYPTTGSLPARSQISLRHLTNYVVRFLNDTGTQTDWTKTEIDTALGTTLNMGVDNDYTFVANGSGGISLYINSVLISTKTGISGGTSFYYNSLTFDAKVEITNLYVYDKALTLTDIQGLYNAPIQNLSAKENTITAGTTSQYWRGDKTWVDFFTTARTVTLTGLSTATNAVITATDTILSAFGKLQAQINAITTALALKQDIIYEAWLAPFHGGFMISTSSATATAGRVYLQEFEVLARQKLDAVVLTNQATVAGNVIVGIYGPVATQEVSTGLPLLVESSSTALSGVNSPQVITFSEITVNPGLYYVAIEFSDATHTFTRQPSQTTMTGLTSYYDRAGGYGALTNPTPTTTNNASAFPMLRIRGKSL